MRIVNQANFTAEKLILSYYNQIKGEGYKVSEIDKKQYNFEFTVELGKEKLKLLVYFGKRGVSTILQGNKESGLFFKINEMVFGTNLFEKSSLNIDEPDSYIGTDESGKGDYFGPLVIAGVFVDTGSLNVLKKIGVRDSKEIADPVIKKLAVEIKKIVNNNYDIISITPGKYNELYKKIGNVNKILGWAHAKVLENLLAKCPAREAISDKFGDERLIKDALQTKGKTIVLHQFTKAERFTGVAAASILARDAFNGWFEEKKKEIKMELKKGASSEVEKTAARIILTHGQESLSELVKLHFKTTIKIIRPNYLDLIRRDENGN